MPIPSIEPDLITSPQTYRVRGQKSAFVYPDERLLPTDTVVLKNLNFTERQTMKKRFGFDEWVADQITETGSARALVGLLQTDFKAGTRQIEVAGTKIYANDGTTRKDITGNAQTNAADSRVRFAFMQDKVIGVNGTNQVWTWGGDFSTPASTANLSGVDFTTCEDVVVHRNLLFALNTTEGGTNQSTRVRWCDVNTEFFTVDVTKWPSNNRTEIYHDSAAIVGGCDFDGKMLVFKKDGMYPTQVFVNVGYLELRILEDNVKRGFEPIAKNSIISHPLFAFFVARDGAYVVGKDLSPTNITLPLQSNWFSDLNQSRIQHAVSFVRQRDHQVRTLLSSTSNDTGHDRVLVWDWETNDVWFDVLPVPVNFAASWILSDVEYDMLGTSTGFTHRGNDSGKTEDNGANINWEAKTAPNDLRLPGRVKNIIKVDTIYRPLTNQNDISFELIRDQGQQSSISSTLDINVDLAWNDGKDWNSGEAWPGGLEAVETTFVNRSAEVVQARWYGDVNIELIGYRVHFEVTEN